MYRELPIGQACSPCNKGLGSIDLSTLSWEDYLLIGVVGMFGIGLVFPSVFEASKPKRKRKRKAVSGKAGFLSGTVTAVLLLGGGYVAYRYLTPDATE